MGLTQTPFLAMQGGAIWVHFMHLNLSPIPHHCSQIHSLPCTFTTNSTTCTYSSIIAQHCSHMHQKHPMPCTSLAIFSHHTSSLQPPFTLVVNHILSHCIIHPHASLTNKHCSHKHSNTINAVGYITIPEIPAFQPSHIHMHSLIIIHQTCSHISTYSKLSCSLSFTYK